MKAGRARSPAGSTRALARQDGEGSGWSGGSREENRSSKAIKTDLSGGDYPGASPAQALPVKIGRAGEVGQPVTAKAAAAPSVR